MLVLSSSWGGRAEHGILTVEAYIKDHKLIIIAKDSYYNDYSPTGLAEKGKVCCDEIMVDGMHVDRRFLFEKIRNLLSRNQIRDYRFDISDIRKMEGIG